MTYQSAGRKRGNRSRSRSVRQSRCNSRNTKRSCNRSKKGSKKCSWVKGKSKGRRRSKGYCRKMSGGLTSKGKSEKIQEAEKIVDEARIQRKKHEAELNELKSEESKKAFYDFEKLQKKQNNFFMGMAYDHTVKAYKSGDILFVGMNLASWFDKNKGRKNQTDIEQLEKNWKKALTDSGIYSRLLDEDKLFAFRFESLIGTIFFMKNVFDVLGNKLSWWYGHYNTKEIEQEYNIFKDIIESELKEIEKELKGRIEEDGKLKELARDIFNKLKQENPVDFSVDLDILKQENSSNSSNLNKLKKDFCHELKKIIEIKNECNKLKETIEEDETLKGLARNIYNGLKERRTEKNLNDLDDLENHFGNTYLVPFNDQVESPLTKNIFEKKISTNYEDLILNEWNKLAANHADPTTEGIGINKFFKFVHNEKKTFFFKNNPRDKCALFKNVLHVSKKEGGERQYKAISNCGQKSLEQLLCQPNGSWVVDVSKRYKVDNKTSHLQNIFQDILPNNKDGINTIIFALCESPGLEDNDFPQIDGFSNKQVLLDKKAYKTGGPSGQMCYVIYSKNSIPTNNRFRGGTILNEQFLSDNEPTDKKTVEGKEKFIPVKIDFKKYMLQFLGEGDDKTDPEPRSSDLTIFDLSIEKEIKKGKEEISVKNNHDIDILNFNKKLFINVHAASKGCKTGVLDALEQLSSEILQKNSDIDEVIIVGDFNLSDSKCGTNSPEKTKAIGIVSDNSKGFMSNLEGYRIYKVRGGNIAYNNQLSKFGINDEVDTYYIMVRRNNLSLGGRRRSKCSRKQKRRSCRRSKRCSWVKKSKRGSRGHCRKRGSKSRTRRRSKNRSRRK